MRWLCVSGLVVFGIGGGMARAGDGADAPDARPACVDQASGYVEAVLGGGVVWELGKNIFTDGSSYAQPEGSVAARGAIGLAYRWCGDDDRGYVLHVGPMGQITPQLAVFGGEAALDRWGPSPAWRLGLHASLGGGGIQGGRVTVATFGVRALRGPLILELDGIAGSSPARLGTDYVGVVAGAGVKLEGRNGTRGSLAVTALGVLGGLLLLAALAAAGGSG